MTLESLQRKGVNKLHHNTMSHLINGFRDWKPIVVQNLKKKQKYFSGIQHICVALLTFMKANSLVAANLLRYIQEACWPFLR